MTVDKPALHQDLIRALETARERLLSAQRTSQEGLTHEEARAEGDKDTRATEASYIARGQAMRVEALEAELAKVRSVRVRSFAAGEPVALSALVTLEAPDGRRTVYLAPAGGGLRLQADTVEVHVVTPSSPLGKALIGAAAGQVVQYMKGSREEEADLLEVT